MERYPKTLSDAINAITCIPSLVALERFGSHYIINEDGVLVFKDAETHSTIQPILYTDLKYDVISKKEFDKNV